MKKIIPVLIFFSMTVPVIYAVGANTVNFTGFETGDASECVSTAGTFSISSVTFKSGKYAMRTNPTTVNFGDVRIGSINPDGSSTGNQLVGHTGYFNFDFMYRIIPTTTSTEEFVQIRDTSTAIKFTMRLTSNPVIIAYDANINVLSTGTTVLAFNTWNNIGIKISTGSSTGAYSVFINGNLEFSGTGNIGALDPAFIQLGKGVNRNSNTVDFYYDNYFCSSTTFRGAGGESFALLPVSTGTSQTWSIGAGSGTHWFLVSERPPDGNTTELRSSGSVGAGETEYVSSGSAIVEGVINSVKSYSDIERNGATNGTFKPALVVNGTIVSPANNASSGAAFAGFFVLEDTNPANGLTWVPTDLNLIQTGAIEENNVGNLTLMTATYLMVDFTPPPEVPENGKVFIGSGGTNRIGINLGGANSVFISP